jgi:Immunity protein 49
VTSSGCTTWPTDCKSESRNSHGWVALGPLALGCLAYDRGITVDVRSDYLLPYLIVNRAGE